MEENGMSRLVISRDSFFFVGDNFALFIIWIINLFNNSSNSIFKKIVALIDLLKSENLELTVNIFSINSDKSYASFTLNNLFKLMHLLLLV